MMVLHASISKQTNDIKVLDLQCCSTDLCKFIESLEMPLCPLHVVFHGEPAVPVHDEGDMPGNGAGL